PDSSSTQTTLYNLITSSDSLPPSVAYDAIFGMWPYALLPLLFAAKEIPEAYQQLKEGWNARKRSKVNKEKVHRFDTFNKHKERLVEQLRRAEADYRKHTRRYQAWPNQLKLDPPPSDLQTRELLRA